MVDLVAVLSLQGRARRNALHAAHRLGRERAQAKEAAAATAAAAEAADAAADDPPAAGASSPQVRTAAQGRRG